MYRSYYGVTFGLAETSNDNAPEQVYVLPTGDASRPIQVEAWRGYSAKSVMILTRQQAAELAMLLTGFVGAVKIAPNLEGHLKPEKRVR